MLYYPEKRARVRGKEPRWKCTEYRNLIQSLTGDNDELVFQFFVFFSRFECALKRAHFVKEGAYGSASPHWNEFADKLNGQLAGITDRAFLDAKSYLLRDPPKKQMFNKSDKSIRWENNSRRSNESEEQYLLRLVRDVRNNLFHGGKYPSADGGPVNGQVLRNSKLLDACLTVLNECRSLDADVKCYFEKDE